MTWQRVKTWLRTWVEFIAAFVVFWLVGLVTPEGWGVVPLAAAAGAYFVAKKVWRT